MPILKALLIILLLLPFETQQFSIYPFQINIYQDMLKNMPQKGKRNKKRINLVKRKILILEYQYLGISRQINVNEL